MLHRCLLDVLQNKKTTASTYTELQCELCESVCWVLGCIGACWVGSNMWWEPVQKKAENKIHLKIRPGQLLDRFVWILERRWTPNCGQVGPDTQTVESVNPMQENLVKTPIPTWGDLTAFEPRSQKARLNIEM